MENNKNINKPRTCRDYMDRICPNNVNVNRNQELVCYSQEILCVSMNITSLLYNVYIF